MNARYLKYKESYKRYAKTHANIIKKCQDSFNIRHPERRKQIAKKYANTPKGRLNYLNKTRFHNPIHHLSHRLNWIVENCAVCNTNKNIEMHHPNPDMPLHIYFLCKKHHFEQRYRRK